MDILNMALNALLNLLGTAPIWVLEAIFIGGWIVLILGVAYWGFGADIKHLLKRRVR